MSSLIHGFEYDIFISYRQKDNKHDGWGLKIKLPNGNVANRLIPIQIHDLYPEDKALVEK